MHATCGVRPSHVAAGHRAVMTSCARSPAPNCRPVPHRSQRLMRCTVGTGIDPGVVPGPPGVTPGTPGPSISPRQPGGGDPAPGTVPDIDPGTPPSVDPQSVPGGVPDPGVSPGLDPGVITPGDPNRL